MKTMDLFDMRETLKTEGILICFAGPFSHGIIEELGNAVRRYLETMQMKKALLMDVFSVFIEQTQNVRNYAQKKLTEGNTEYDFNCGIVIIGRKGNKYVVSSGNIVEKKDLEEAIARLAELNRLDKDGLKAAYREQMRKVIPSGKTTSGLGFIDMSRKASEPLQYSIREINETYCFFTLRAVI